MTRQSTPSADGTRSTEQRVRTGGRSSGSVDSSSQSVFDPESSAVTSGWAHGDEDDADDSNAAVATLRFVYRYSTALVPASVVWALLSLPLVTAGPASVGLYATVLSLRETGRVDRDRVRRTVRATLVPATLFGFVPVAFVGIATLYVLSGFSTGLVGMGLTAGALYAGLYLGVLMIPTLVMLAAGREPKPALRDAYLWIAGEPTAGLQLLLVTLVVFVATLGLTIGFVLLFGAIAATYHTEVVTRAIRDDDTPLGGDEGIPAAGG
ncbi:hypothetical protein ACFQL1_12310 [Halomicroarcula sp. GCM10025709]|uniref:hypothetical protein n=1 Tax=Haloarcula TaxID=2237 RepID=UPI0024C2D982|nr:hypothetical protein [Halomicroarcula sp. YJ-61-S]